MIVETTEVQLLETAGSGAQVPSKLWEYYYETSATEFCGTFALNAQGAFVPSGTVNEPPYTGLSWPAVLAGANRSSTRNYAVYSSAVSVPANHSYKLERQVTKEAGVKVYPFLPLSEESMKPGVWRFGSRLVSIDLISTITLNTTEEPGESGTGQ
jgi:hypothetical protein